MELHAASVELLGGDRAQEARSYLRQAAGMETLCRGLDRATPVAGVWLLITCLDGNPLLGLIPFGLCLIATAVATRYNRACMARAHRATLEVQNTNPQIDDGCGCH